MTLAAGKLRHRVQLQTPADLQDETTGGITRVWTTVATVWAAVEPLSAREFVQSAAEQSQVSARITIRRRSDINGAWRIVHGTKVYNVEGVLADKDSGLEYQTIVVSEGTRDQPGQESDVIIDGGGDPL
jgi:SPP1 family predicted phage head-tail adaptor